ADGVRDVCHLVVGVDSHTARLFANADFSNLIGDIVALLIFDFDDGHTVRLTIDDDKLLLAGCKSDSGRVAWGCSPSFVPSFVLIVTPISSPTGEGHYTPHPH